MGDNNPVLALPSAAGVQEGDSGVRALKRFSRELKCYDCRHKPCQHDPPGDHGISGGRWIFAVSTGQAAVVLVVLTSFYPDTVPKGGWIPGWPSRRDIVTGCLELHLPVQSGNDCEYMESGHCTVEHLGYGICDQFGPLLSDTLEPQSEEFWAKLGEFLP